MGYILGRDNSTPSRNGGMLRIGPLVIMTQKEEREEREENELCAAVADNLIAKREARESAAICPQEPSRKSFDDRMRQAWDKAAGIADLNT